MAEKIKSITVPLSSPVEHDGKVYSELTFRRMKAKDTLAGEDTDSELEAGYRLFAALAEVPYDVIAELDIDDLTDIGEKVTPLMGKQAAANVAAKRAMAEKALLGAKLS